MGFAQRMVWGSIVIIGLVCASSVSAAPARSVANERAGERASKPATADAAGNAVADVPPEDQTATSEPAADAIQEAADAEQEDTLTGDAGSERAHNPGMRGFLEQAIDALSWASTLRFQGLMVLWGRAEEPVADGGAALDPGSSNFDVPGNFQMRFARLVVKANPHPKVAGKLVLAFDNAVPLFDYEVLAKVTPYVQFAAGQWRMHLGGQISTPAANLVLLDRPGYTFGMAKARYRDMGVRLQSDPHGILDGVVNYRVALMNGSGILTRGAQPISETLGQMLLIGRLVLDAAPLLYRPVTDDGQIVYTKNRLRLGAFLAATRDRAASPGADGAPNPADAQQRLGTVLVPFGEDRQTALGGVDVEIKIADFWLLTEVLALYSAAERSQTTSLGGSLDAAYTIAPLMTQVAGRIALFDPLLDAGARDEVLDVVAGLNYIPLRWLFISGFVGSKTEAAIVTSGGRPSFRVEGRVGLRY